MKSLTLLLVTIFFVANIRAQSTWYNTFFNNPNNITKILPKDDSTYFCFTMNNNTYLKTTNAGNNWTTIKFTDSLIDIRDGQFINPQLGWIVGSKYPYPYKPYIFKTTNGGLNWLGQVYDSSFCSLWSINFLNENTGWIGGTDANGVTGKISKTTNGGINWISQFFPNSNIIRKFYFANDSTGWLLGSHKYFAKTTDYGTTWINIATNTPLADKLLFSFCTLNASDFWVTSHGYYPDLTGYIYYSSNAGQNWTLKYSYPSENDYYGNILFINNSTGILSGNIMNILNTTNSGSNWFVSYPNLPFKSYSMCYYNNKIFVGGGTQVYSDDPITNTVIKSTNAGNNWFNFEYNWDYIFGDVHFSDNNNGLALATDHARVYKTINGGVNWFLTYQNYNLQSGKFAFMDNLTGYINCNNNIHLYTTNYGTNWSEINEPFSTGFIKFINQTTGWTFSSDFLMKTTNSGFNWTVVPLSAISSCQITDLCFTNETTGWVLANKTVHIYPYTTIYYTSILRTTNGGSIWQQAYSYSSQSTYYTQFKFFNPSDGILLASNKFLKSTDSGFNWFDDQSNFNIYANNFYMQDLNTGWVSGLGYGISKTTNGGHNWILQFSSPNTYAVSMFALDNNVWFGSNHSDIYHSTNGGNVFIGKISSEIPRNYYLGQNYPNPFNPITNVKFSMLNAGDVKIIIYDIQGREVQTLVNERLGAGTYEVTFDAHHGGSSSSLTSGVYFYRMVIRHGGSSTEEFSETKKMLLIK